LIQRSHSRKEHKKLFVHIIEGHNRVTMGPPATEYRVGSKIALKLLKK